MEHIDHKMDLSNLLDKDKNDHWDFQYKLREYIDAWKMFKKYLSYGSSWMRT